MSARQVDERLDRLDYALSDAGDGHLVSEELAAARRHMRDGDIGAALQHARRAGVEAIRLRHGTAEVVALLDQWAADRVRSVELDEAEPRCGLCGTTEPCDMHPVRPT